MYPPLEPGVFMGRRSHAGFPFDQPGLVPTHLGRGAVWLALQALGLGKGKRIAMPAYHCGSEVEAAHLAGLEIEFYRVDGDLWVDEDDMRRVAEGCDATYLISHFGFPMPEPPPGVVIEDAAHGLFSADGDRPLGSRGDAAIFCPRKSLGVPDGGAVVVREAGSGRGAEGTEGEQAGAGDELLQITSEGSKQNAEVQDTDRPRAGGRAMLRSVASLALGRAALSRLSVLRRAAAAASARASRERRAAEAGELTEVVIGEWDLEIADMEAAARRPTRLTERITRRVDAERIAVARRSNYEFLRDGLADFVPGHYRRLPSSTTPLYLPVIAADRPRTMIRLLDGGVRALEIWPVPHPLLDRERFPELEPARRGLVALPVHQSLRPEHMEAVLAAAKRAL